MAQDQLYTNDYAHLTPCEAREKIEIRCERITAAKYGLKQALLWNIATLGKTKAYAVYDGAQRIHFSYVVRGREKFRFLGKSDIEIGPCWTHEKYRGRGIYPAVLSSIIKKELAGGYSIYADPQYQ